MAKGYPPGAGDPQFFKYTASFLKGCCSQHIHIDPKRFFAVCGSFRAHGVALQKPKHCIMPLLIAIRRFSVGISPGTILPAHAELFRVCLLAKCYSAADEFLTGDVSLTVAQATTQVTATDVLLYCYYGSMILIGKRRYRRALDLLLTAITVPTYVVNAITIACIKKYVLVALLHMGYVPDLPKETPKILRRALKNELGLYIELARLGSVRPSTTSPLKVRLLLDDPSLSTKSVPEDRDRRTEGRSMEHDASTISSIRRTDGRTEAFDDDYLIKGLSLTRYQRLRQFASENTSVWASDGNAGLVRCFLDRHIYHRIRSLTITFTSMGLGILAERAGVSSGRSAEETLLRMIDDGELDARIDQADASVEFACNVDDHDSGDGHGIRECARLHRLIEKCIQLSEDITQVDYAVSCDRAFLSKVAPCVGADAIDIDPDGRKRTGTSTGEEVVSMGGTPGGILEANCSSMDDLRGGDDADELQAD